MRSCAFFFFFFLLLLLKKEPDICKTAAINPVFGAALCRGDWFRPISSTRATVGPWWRKISLFALWSDDLICIPEPTCLPINCVCLVLVRMGDGPEEKELCVSDSKDLFFPPIVTSYWVSKWKGVYYCVIICVFVSSEQKALENSVEEI